MPRVGTLLLSLALALAGCQAPVWKRADAPVRAAGPEGSSVEVPAGWIYLESPQQLAISRDGPRVQLMSVVLRKEALFLEDRRYDPAQSPAELAELFVADWKAGPGVGEITVLANAPATIAGRPGFRLHLRHNAHHVRMPIDEFIVYGFGHAGGLFVLSLGDWPGHHFERDLPAFEALVRSLTLSS